MLHSSVAEKQAPELIRAPGKMGILFSQMDFLRFCCKKYETPIEGGGVLAGLAHDDMLVGHWGC